MPPWPGSGNAPPLTAGQCYRFCLGSPHVHAVLTGPANRAQLDANLDALADGPLPAAEEAWIRAYGRQVRAMKKIPFL
jgi:predicted aldo/keto reductase-like oxidoreductase